MRTRAAAMLAAGLLACAACSGGGTANGGSGGAARSCADLVVIAGTSYIGGRGDGAQVLPRTGAPVNAVRPPCQDGNEPSSPVVVHTIPGVPTTDAVAGPLGEVMLAERWWQQPRESLPAALRPYVRR